MKYNREVKIINTGTVLQVDVNLACIYGLDEVMTDELVELEEGTYRIKQCWCCINGGWFADI